MAEFQMDLTTGTDESRGGTETADHRPSVTPTLVVGLGGMGTQAVRLLKRRLVWLWHRPEIEAELDRVPNDMDPRAWRSEVWRRFEIEGGPPIVQLLAVDTWPWSNRPGQVYLNQHEYAYIGGYNATTVLKNLDNHPEIAEWWTWPEGLTRPGQIHSGARQIRAIGRLSFYRRYPEFLAKLEPQVARTSSIEARQVVENRGYQVADSRAATRIYILTSLCGGTGAGTWMDVAAKIRAKFSEAAIITGVFGLPSVFLPELRSDLQKERIQANAYAALKELNHFQSHTYELWLPGEERHSVSPLFNRLYLVGRQNKAGDSLNSVQDVCQLIANQVFLESLTHVGSRAWEYDVNVTMERREQDGHVIAYNFSSFANSSLIVPREQMLEYCELTYAQQLLRHGLLRELSPEDENQIGAELQVAMGRLTDLVAQSTGAEQTYQGELQGEADSSTLGPLEQVQQDVNAAAQRYGVRGASYLVQRLTGAVEAQLQQARRRINRQQSQLENLQEELHRLSSSEPWWARWLSWWPARVFTGRALRSRRRRMARGERRQRELRGRLDELISTREQWDRLHASLVPLVDQIRERIRVIQGILESDIQRARQRLFGAQPTRDQPPYEMLTMVLGEHYFRSELNPRLVGSAAARRFGRDVKQLLQAASVWQVRLRISEARKAGGDEYPTTLALTQSNSSRLEEIVRSTATRAVRETVPPDWFDIREILDSGNSDFLTRLRNMFHRCQPFWRYDLDIGGLSERDLEQVTLAGVADTDHENWRYLLRDFPEFQVVETDDPSRIDACRIEHGLPIQFLESLERLSNRYHQFVIQRSGPMQLDAAWEPGGDEPLPDLIEPEGEVQSATPSSQEQDRQATSEPQSDTRGTETPEEEGEDGPFL